MSSDRDISTRSAAIQAMEDELNKIRVHCRFIPMKNDPYKSIKPLYQSIRLQIELCKIEMRDTSTSSDEISKNYQRLRNDYLQLTFDFATLLTNAIE